MLHSNTENKEGKQESRDLKKADKFFAKAEKAYSIGDTKNGQKYEKKATDYKTSARTHHDNIQKDIDAQQKIALERTKLANHEYTPPPAKKAASKSADKAGKHAEKAEDKSQEAQKKADEGKPAQADAKAASADREANKADSEASKAKTQEQGQAGAGAGAQTKAHGAEVKADQARDNIASSDKSTSQNVAVPNSDKTVPNPDKNVHTASQNANVAPPQAGAQAYNSSAFVQDVQTSVAQFNQRTGVSSVQQEALPLGDQSLLDPALRQAPILNAVDPSVIEPFLQYHQQNGSGAVSSYHLGNTYVVENNAPVDSFHSAMGPSTLHGSGAMPYNGSPSLEKYAVNYNVSSETTL